MREIAQLPGPRGWPIVGNALQVDRARIHQEIEAWGREFGPFFKFSLGRNTLLGVTDHEALGAALRDRPDGFRRSELLEAIGREMGMTPGLFAANGDDWRRQRRMVMAAFDPRHVKAYQPSLAKVARRLKDRWLRAASAGVAVELQPELMRFTVDAIAGLAFGVEVNTLESDDEVIQQHLDKIFPALFRRVLSLVPWWRYFPTRSDRELEHSMAAVNAAIAGFVATARARLSADPQRREHPPNLLEAMVVATESEASGITDLEVAGNVLTMLLAGEDTTANTLAWLIYLLSRNPQALRRAEAEVRGLGALEYSVEQMATLDYLEACAHETMRLKPVAPFQILQALRDTQIGDVRVPEHTRVWCVMRGDSMTEQHFPDPGAFRPERWLAESSPGAAASSAKRVSMPFGAGPRICPGRYLALLEIKMAMAMLLDTFEIDSVETPDGQEAAERMAFTMMPVGLRMRLRVRARGRDPG